MVLLNAINSQLPFSDISQDFNFSPLLGISCVLDYKTHNYTKEKKGIVILELLRYEKSLLSDFPCHVFFLPIGRYHTSAFYALAVVFGVIDSISAKLKLMELHQSKVSLLDYIPELQPIRKFLHSRKILIMAIVFLNW